jgi:hypothetical protein
MARTYTRAELRKRSLFLADMVEGSNEYAATARVDDLINVHAAHVYEMMIQTGPPDYFSSSLAVTSGPVTISSSLPTMRAVTGVFANEPSSRKRKLIAIDDSVLHKYTPITGTIDATVEYIPRIAVIATGSGTDDSTTFDGVGGWEDLICLRVARDLRTREQTDISALQMQVGESEAMLQGQMRRRVRGAFPIAMVEDYDAWAWPWSNTLCGYRLRGDTLEFFVT